MKMEAAIRRRNGLVDRLQIVVVEGFLRLVEILNHLGSLQAPLLGGLQCHKMQQVLRFSLYAPTSVFTTRQFYWEHSQSQGSISSFGIHSELQTRRDQIPQKAAPY
jgi:hypothetical protein